MTACGSWPVPLGSYVSRSSEPSNSSAIAQPYSCPGRQCDLRPAARLHHPGLVEATRCLWRGICSDSRQDGDAIGKEPAEALSLPENASDEEVEQLVWKQLRTCFDPEIQLNIVDLGLSTRPTEHPRRRQRGVEVKMTLTARAAAWAKSSWTTSATSSNSFHIAEADVELVFDPPWGRP